MSMKAVVLLLLIAIGLPLFIFYSIFFQSPAVPLEGLAGFEGYKTRILEMSPSAYEILSVADEGLAVRVDILILEPDPGPMGARIQATNALYDIQTVVGRDVSVAVWTYSTAPPSRSSLLGMAFFRALTEQQFFKSPSELP